MQFRFNTNDKFSGISYSRIFTPLSAEFQIIIDRTLELEIRAETPIFTRGTREGSAFFDLPDGRKAPPGTLLKGAIRNVVEIATFGRMEDRVNEHRHAVRDLQNRELYGRFMADVVFDPTSRKREPMPLVNAGRLRRTRGEVEGEEDWQYEIEVCDFAKIEYGRIEEVARSRGVSGFQPGEKQSSVNKYATWDKT